MTAYFRQSNLKAGDEVTLTRSNNQLSIDYKRESSPETREIMADGQKKTVLVLGGGWKVIDY
jgi:antitoxin component of MazEF toxin-antitoxin module